MELDETSRVIGQLEADVSSLKTTTTAMDEKLDRLLARTNTMRLTFKHWLIVLGGGTVGGGSLAHLLRKMLE